MFAMAREMVAMWRTANRLVGFPREMPSPASDAIWNQADEMPPESAAPKPHRRDWIPNLEQTPPLVQFLVRLARWLKAKCRSEATQVPQLRLIGQLALGAKRHLSLVEVGGVQFLVGGGVEHVTVIAPIPNGVLNSTENPQNTGRPHPL
jgi:hypothetical protein